MKLYILPLLLPLVSLSQKTVPIHTAAIKTIQVGEKPDFIAIDGNDAWVVDDHQGRIIKVAVNKEKPLLTVPVPEACTSPIVGFNAVWVMSCTEKKLYRIDHKTGAVLAKLATGIADANGEMSLATGDGSIWLLSDSTGILLRIDPATNTVQKKIHVLPHSYCVAFDGKDIWVSNSHDNSVQRVSTVSNQVIATIHTGAGPRFLTAIKEGVWTLNQGDGTVSRIDPVLNRVVATTNVKAVGSGGDIAADGKKVWVVSTNPDRPVQTIGIASNRVDMIYSQEPLPGKPLKVDGAVRVGDKYVWVSGYHSRSVWVFRR